MVAFKGDVDVVSAQRAAVVVVMGSLERCCGLETLCKEWWKSGVDQAGRLALLSLLLFLLMTMMLLLLLLLLGNLCPCCNLSPFLSFVTTETQRLALSLGRCSGI